jgi:hypothetical protein
MVRGGKKTCLKVKKGAVLYEEKVACIIDFGWNLAACLCFAVCKG